MINLAIVEDEKLYIDQLKEYVERYRKESGYDISVRVFEDGEDILENYRGDLDIILMDIQMQFMDGMTAAEKIREMDAEVIIMFITNMAGYAIRGYAVDALDYILKPVTYFSFSQKLTRAIERVNKRKTKPIYINIPSGVQKVNISDIYYIESRGHNLIFKTKRGEFSSRGKMQDYEDMLSGEGFFRSNKGYLVNLRYVDGVDDNCCIIQGEQLVISRARKNDFMKALADYIDSMT